MTLNSRQSYCLCRLSQGIRSVTQALQECVLHSSVHGNTKRKNGFSACDYTFGALGAADVLRMCLDNLKWVTNFLGSLFSLYERNEG